MRKADQNAIAFVVVFFFLVSSLNGSLTSGFHTSGGPDVQLGSSTTTTFSSTSTSSTNYLCCNYAGGGGGGGGSSQTSTSSSSSTTSTSTTTTLTTTTTTGSYGFWNQNSQNVANYLVQWGWNNTIQMLSDPHEPGCFDYVGGKLCGNTFWTTSDNVPTCWTLFDFHFGAQGSACINRLISLGAFLLPLDGMRYEAYAGYPIITGNPGDHHGILLPNGTLFICTNIPCPGYTYGVNNGVSYNIQSDAWNNLGRGKPNPNAGVDIAGPQAINAWLRGDNKTFWTIVNALVARYVNSNYVPDGSNSSTWQLGQVLFLMRIAGLDNTVAFYQMVNLLWSLQNPLGFLPNQYSGFGKPESGHDPENQDAGLLPFSQTLVQTIKGDFGKYNSGSWPT